MKWKRIKYVLTILVVWLIALSLLYIVYLKVKYLFNI